MQLDLYIDLFQKRLVNGVTSQTNFQLPALFQGDTVPIKLAFLKPTGILTAPYSVESIANYGIRVAIGAAPTGTPGGPTPLALQTVWTHAGDELSATGELSLSTAEVATHIGTASSKGAFFEVELSKDGKFDTVLQAGLTLKAEIIEGNTIPPSVLNQGASFNNLNGVPGGEIRLISPDGLKMIVLSCDNAGVFHADSFDL